MSTKFNIYYATTANGPWTLANEDPITRIAAGNEYTVTGLKRDTLYYVAIVGGYEDSNEFVPLTSQAIGPKSGGVGGVEVQSAAPFAVRTFTPSITSEGYLGHQFGVT
jgi:hypothetical protein